MSLNKSLFLNSQLLTDSVESKSTRAGFGDALAELGAQNPNVVVLTADLNESTQTQKFSQKFPERFFDVGVAEQNMAGIAAGLALSGKIVFMSSYGVFSPGRNWDQIRVSICYSKANVKIVSSHTGLSAGPDGATHQALEDLALMRVLPNMTVIQPCDYESTKKAVEAAAKMAGPVYLRLVREKTPEITTAKTPFEIGTAQVLQEGKDLTVVACGPIIHSVLKASNKLKDKKGHSIEVINCHTIKPLDVKTILASAKKTQQVLVVEEHQINGGLGGAVAEALSEKFAIKIKRMGMPDSFGESGTYGELLEKYGLSEKAIETEIKNLLS